jgi:hypothetical protein
MASVAARWTTVRLGTVALLALLAGLTAAPREASAAGCVHPGTTGGAAHLDGLAAVGALAPIDAGPSRPLPVSPCAGLRCSTGDPFAPAPAAPTIGPRADTWGILPGAAPAAGRDPAPFPFDEPDARPLRSVVALLRPPR